MRPARVTVKTEARPGVQWAWMRWQAPGLPGTRRWSPCALALSVVVMASIAPKFEALGGAISAARAAGERPGRRTAIVTKSAAPRARAQDFLPVNTIHSFASALVGRSDGRSTPLDRGKIRARERLGTHVCRSGPCVPRQPDAPTATRELTSPLFPRGGLGIRPGLRSTWQRHTSNYARPQEFSQRKIAELALSPGSVHFAKRLRSMPCIATARAQTLSLRRHSNVAARGTPMTSRNTRR